MILRQKNHKMEQLLIIRRFSYGHLIGLICIITLPILLSLKVDFHTVFNNITAIDYLFFVAIIVIAPFYIYILCALIVDIFNRSIFYRNTHELVVKYGPLPSWKIYSYTIDSISKLQAIEIKGDFRTPNEYCLEIIKNDGKQHVLLDRLDSLKDVLEAKHQLSLLKNNLEVKEGIDLNLTQSAYIARCDNDFYKK